MVEAVADMVKEPDDIAAEIPDRPEEPQPHGLVGVGHRDE
jgi:hypothetical protein